MTMDRHVHAALRKLRRRGEMDFSDYLELRRLRDLGAKSPQLDAWIAHAERAMPVPFAAALPDLATLAPGAQIAPRDLTHEEVRVAFAMREEFAAHGAARAGLMGFDLPEGRGLKDWLDLVETERQEAKKVRESMRRFDAKLWALLTGERKRLPTCAIPPLAGPQ
ncbi:MAG: hypothetical protein QOE90_1057 [Thermoplasmata archaeon]|jgi:hypothetical protein|nr:hypothetical protein [Thermoplasmata archaeon]